MKNNSYSVAVLGAGNIGSAVIERLENLDNEIVEINLKSVLVSDISKERTFNNDVVTDNFEDILKWRVPSERYQSKLQKSLQEVENPSSFGGVMPN